MRLPNTFFVKTIETVIQQNRLRDWSQFVAAVEEQKRAQHREMRKQELRDWIASGKRRRA